MNDETRAAVKRWFLILLGVGLFFVLNLLIMAGGIAIYAYATAKPDTDNSQPEIPGGVDPSLIPVAVGNRVLYRSDDGTKRDGIVREIVADEVRIERIIGETKRITAHGCDWVSRDAIICVLPMHLQPDLPDNGSGTGATGASQ